MGKILVVGSLAYDSVRTPSGKADGALGGSANYFGLSSSLLADAVNVVGVVGEDYKEEDKQLLTNRGIDISGVETVAGKTFRWEGEYTDDLNEAKTLKTELNVFESFKPRLPDSYLDSDYIFLANIDPVLQMDVLSQVKKPKFVAADTMNFWIESKLDALKELLPKLDLLMINEGEAKMLTGLGNAVAAAEKIVSMGPKAIMIKRGEYGFIFHVDGEYHALPAFPVKNVVDPTGAGDTFAGGVMGYMAKNNCDVSWAHLKNAAVYGTLLASFTVQDFSVNALRQLTLAQVEDRLKQYRQVVSMAD